MLTADFSPKFYVVLRLKLDRAFWHFYLLLQYVFLGDSALDTPFQGPRVCGSSVTERRGRDYLIRPAENKVADIREFAYVAAVHTFDLVKDGEKDPSRISDDGSFVGSILGPSVVLTACHCVAKELGQVGKNQPESLRAPYQFGVHAGVLDDDPTLEGGQLRWVFYSAVHPQCEIIYSESTLNITLYDLAVLVTEEEFHFVPEVQPLVIPEYMAFNMTDILGEHVHCLTVGWFWTHLLSKGVPLPLRSIHVYVDELHECDGTITQKEETNYNQTVLCISTRFPPNDPKAIFRGDSGSPIMCLRPFSREQVIVGIKSTEANASKDVGEFARLDSGVEWIKQIVGNPPSPDDKDSAESTLQTSRTAVSATLIVAWSVVVL